ncbi:hypothetical protein A7325_13160 [Psychrobacter sp. SHUES1]|jgi:hypothetical protein|nr:hypothetical protein A7325_13160 [Psychrobacter sp. SHUES1]
MISIFATLNLIKKLFCYAYVSHNACAYRAFNNSLEWLNILKTTCKALYVKGYAKSSKIQLKAEK